MIGLYSVNLHVMGKANVALLRVDTVFSYAAGMGLTSDMAMMAVGLVGVMLVGVILYWFFGTELGTAIRATGCNSQMARAQGVNTNSMIVLGLLISNALVALSGALVCQANGFADVGMGTGTIVIVIIGEVLFGTRSFKNCLISVILGSIVYRLVIAIVLQLGMPPNDLKLFTAILVAIALSMPLIREKWRARKSAL
jgi:putative ABC transport system permease protein